MFYYICILKTDLVSILEKKSIENFQAIDLLINGKLNAPVIHCAYYSSLQLLIHNFYKYTGISEAQAISNIKANGKSHQYFLNMYVEEIKTLDSRNASKFLNFFNSFKRKRNESDYNNIDINDSDSKEAKVCAEKIKIFLNKVSNEGKCENIYNI